MDAELVARWFSKTTTTHEVIAWLMRRAESAE